MKSLKDIEIDSANLFCTAVSSDRLRQSAIEDAKILRNAVSVAIEHGQDALAIGPGYVIDYIKEKFNITDKDLEVKK